MDDHVELYLDSGGSHANNLAAGADALTLVRTDGQVEPLDPHRCAVLITEEPPPLEQMHDDLGAICEVFRQSSNFYLSVTGVSLMPGDTLSIRYPGEGAGLLLRVIEMENGRARIDPPAPLLG